MTPSRTCFSENGLIMSCSWDILRIQRSLLSMELLREICNENFYHCVIRYGCEPNARFIRPQNTRAIRAARPDPSQGKMRPPQDDNVDLLLTRNWLGACQFTGYMLPLTISLIPL